MHEIANEHKRSSTRFASERPTRTHSRIALTILRCTKGECIRKPDERSGLGSRPSQTREHGRAGASCAAERHACQKESSSSGASASLLKLSSAILGAASPGARVDLAWF